jgi:translation initiation factor IF-2
MTKLFEGLERGDLKRLVHSELHIDEFKSKLGDDQDVVVISFKVAGKEPAQDLVNFIEKGYDWVIDADVSSGEMDDGDYIVFIEGDRDNKIAERIVEMMGDIMNTTEQETSEWRVRYYTSQEDHELSLDSLRELIPSSPEAYREKFPDKDEADTDEKEYSADLDKLKSAAGVDVKTKAPKNEFTESLRIAAGIR